MVFLSTPSARRATLYWDSLDSSSAIFLSTPSARRATHLIRFLFIARPISIHALREEGDGSAFNGDGRQLVFLSTPSARRATVTPILV